MVIQRLPSVESCGFKGFIAGLQLNMSSELLKKIPIQKIDKALLCYFKYKHTICTSFEHYSNILLKIQANSDCLLNINKRMETTWKTLSETKTEDELHHDGPLYVSACREHSTLVARGRINAAIQSSVGMLSLGLKECNSIKCSFGELGSHSRPQMT